MNKLFLVLLLAVPSAVYAGAQTGTVSYVEVRASDGLVYFELSGDAKTNSPSCAAEHFYWIIRDENSNAGKQQYAMVLAAQASGKRVFVVGLNSCARWHDGEDLNYIRILE